MKFLICIGSASLLTFLSLCITFYFKDISTRQLDSPIFLYTSLLSILFWSSIYFIINLSRIFLIRFILFFLLSFVLLLLIFSSAIHYKEFGEFISVFSIKFIADDPRYLVDYFYTYLYGMSGVVLFLVTFFMAWSLSRWRLTVDFLKQWKWRIIPFLVIALCLLAVKDLRVKEKSRILPMDIAFAVSNYKYYRSDSSTQELYQAQRLPLESAVEKSPLNIIVIINESWDKLYMPFYTGNEYQAIYPFLGKFVAKPNVLYFEKAFSNSSATDVSVPSILSGVSPHETNRKLHSLPLLWDLGRASGMATAYISSQRASWNKQALFMKSPGPDYFYSADEIQSPVVNDLGIDDLVAVKKVDEVLKLVPATQQLMLVYNTNALHGPFQNSSDLLPPFDFGDRRKNANYIVDQTIKTIIESFAKYKRLENTLIIMTADHGIGRGISNQPRIFSFYDEFVNIPFIVVLPQSLVRKFNELKMIAQDVNITNIDIAPTLFDVLNLGKTNPSFKDKYLGHSLFSDIPKDREIVILNTNEVKQFSYKGFGIVKDNTRFMYSELFGTRFFDVQNDRDMKKDLFSSSSEEIKNYFKFIERNALLRAIYRK